MVLIDEIDEDDPSELTTEELRQEVERLRKIVETDSDGAGLDKLPPNGLGFVEGGLGPSRLRTGACVPTTPQRPPGGLPAPSQAPTRTGFAKELSLW